MAYFDARSDSFHVSSPRHGRSVYLRLGKRLFDVLVALILLPILAVVIFCLCLLARRDGAAGLFAHQRVGQNGATFTCWKIRTMVPDAQSRLRTLLASDPVAREEWARTQKLQNDPRTTALGRFLRRTSLDELPQIWNVLRGDMSLVGPRPVTAPELDRYGAYRHIYLDLRPGVTGLWQVAGRSNGCYAERLAMDQRYAQNIGLFSDLQLIARTAVVVIRPTGR